MMTQKDEIDRDKHMNMILVEFIEAIGRVADKISLPPVFECMEGVPQDLVNTPGDMTVTSKRRRFNKLPLYVKIETLIMLMVEATQKKDYFEKLRDKMSKFHWAQSIADKKTKFVAIDKPYEDGVKVPSNIG